MSQKETLPLKRNKSFKMSASIVSIKPVSNNDLDDFWNLLVEQMDHDLEMHPFLKGMFVATKQTVAADIGSWSDPSKYFEGLIARNELNNEALGCLMFNKAHSFFDGRTIFMAHFVVTEKSRGMRIGQKMMSELVKIAKEENAVIEWNCSSKNVQAIKFYEKFGPKLVSTTVFEGIPDELRRYQLDRNAINKLD